MKLVTVTVAFRRTISRAVVLAFWLMKLPEEFYELYVDAPKD